MAKNKAVKKKVAKKKVAKKTATKKKAVKKTASKKKVVKKAVKKGAKAAYPKRTRAKTRAKKSVVKRQPSNKGSRGNAAVLAELAPKITNAEYRRRRVQLMSMMDANSIAVIPGAQHKRRNRDVDYPFRQDSDFYYLMGFSEPNALLVLCPGRTHGEVILFCAERDPRRELYFGECLGPERAVARLGVDDAFPISDLAEILPGMLEGRERIYATLGEHADFDRRLLGWVKDIRARESGGAIPPGEFVALKHFLHEQRLYKSAAELRLMREAGRISAKAHRRVMRFCRPAVFEHRLEAELTHEFMRWGARFPAYESIVGSGNNGCVLHYVDNAARLKSGELVLIDAGCEYHHYAADITRTIPVNGRFSSSQRALYEVVLEANVQAIAACQPSNDFNRPHEVALDVMIDGLRRLKILKGSRAEILQNGDYRRFCPHKSSHWLGIDVHDVGDYRIDDTWRQLEPGMVLTIEPGIYIPDHPSMKAVSKRWRGMGIRIEDDVLITKDGPEVLTRAAPKSVKEVERTMSQRPLSVSH